jgi:DNA-directed RNA polymerase specialized sigma24 family protein
MSRLDAITTHWSRVQDPTYFVLRYEVAVRKYLSALLKSPEAVQEVMHDVLLALMKRGIDQLQGNAGRFRDYLRTALRHAVFQFWRKRERSPSGAAELETVAAPTRTPSEEIDRLWLTEWRSCLLERTWKVLKNLQDRGASSGPYYTILQLAVQYPSDTSTQLAARAEAALGKPMRADTYRQQLRRARRRFAEILRDEVVNTLDDPTPEALVEEFIDLGILEFMRDYIHPNLRYKLNEAPRSQPAGSDDTVEENID